MKYIVLLMFWHGTTLAIISAERSDFNLCLLGDFHAYSVVFSCFDVCRHARICWCQYDPRARVSFVACNWRGWHFAGASPQEVTGGQGRVDCSPLKPLWSLVNCCAGTGELLSLIWFFHDVVWIFPDCHDLCRLHEFIYISELAKMVIGMCGVFDMTWRVIWNPLCVMGVLYCWNAIVLEWLFWRLIRLFLFRERNYSGDRTCPKRPLLRSR